MLLLFRVYSLTGGPRARLSGDKPKILVVAAVTKIGRKFRETTDNALQIADDVLRGVDRVHGEHERIFDCVEYVLYRSIDKPVRGHGKQHDGHAAKSKIPQGGCDEYSDCP